MKRVNKCARPACGRKFGLVRYFQRCEAYCCQECKRKDTAEKTAKAEADRRRWLAYLTGQP